MAHVWPNEGASNIAAVEIKDPADVRQQLELLRMERKLAVSIGLDCNEQYMADLERQLARWEAAWVGARVTQLAVMRARTRGRRHG